MYCTLILVITMCNIVTTHTRRNVTWTNAWNDCTVAKLDNIRGDAGDIDIPDILPAWTGSSVQVSEWATVVGCLCKSTIGSMDKTFNELRKLFPHDEYSYNSIDEFQCAFGCTKKTIFFIYKDNGCQCLNNHTTTQMNILDKMRQSCARPLHGPNQCDFLLYKFQSYDERKIQKRITDRYLYQCIKLKQMTGNDKAHYQYKFKEDLPSIRMYNCSSLKGNFMKTFANGKNGGYKQLNILFRLYYEEVDDKVKVNRKCVSLESYTEKYNASSYSFQLRDCNAKLPVLCRGHRKETKNDSNVSTTSFITPVENANHLNEGTPVMGIVNVLLFGLLMIFALLYVMVNRRRNALPYPRKMKKSKIIEV